MSIIGSALGYYEVIGNPNDADLVIGHSFGTLTDETSANCLLANYILEHASGRPIVADRMLVNAFPATDQAVDRVVEGPISDTVGKGVGTWGTLVEAQAFMQERSLSCALMVAQAHHIGRIAMQARRLGIGLVVPKGLPAHFDPESDQRWTRGLGWWLPREVFGSWVLRAQGKL